MRRIATITITCEDDNNPTGPATIKFELSDPSLPMDQTSRARNIANCMISEAVVKLCEPGPATPRQIWGQA